MDISYSRPIPMSQEKTNPWLKIHLLNLRMMATHTPGFHFLVSLIPRVWRDKILLSYFKTRSKDPFQYRQSVRQVICNQWFSSRLERFIQLHGLLDCIYRHGWPHWIPSRSGEWRLEWRRFIFVSFLHLGQLPLVSPSSHITGCFDAHKSVRM